MNAVLQALFAQPTFNYDLERVSEKEFSQFTTAKMREKLSLTDGEIQKMMHEYSLLLSMRQLLDSIRYHSEPIEKQKMRLNAVKTASKKFTDSQQHDAQEFLCCVLDDLKEEHRAGFAAIMEAEGKFKTEAEMTAVEVASNPVTANFDFFLQRSLACRQCGKVASESLEPFNNLSIPIPNAEAHANVQRQQTNDKKENSLLGAANTNDDLPDFDNISPMDTTADLNMNKQEPIQECKLSANVTNQFFK